MRTLVLPFLNLAILVAIIVYKARGPFQELLLRRHESTRDGLRSVRDRLKGAHGKYEEFSAKLKTIDAEIAVLREQSHQDAQASRQRIAQEAQRLSAALAVDARSAAGSLFVDLRAQLRRELGERILERAEALLKARLTPENRGKIRREFSQALKGSP
jgi:F0F1-type ATP synthase membrane subunit b/b'